MSFLKLNGRICVTLAALAMLAASPQAARAERRYFLNAARGMWLQSI